jgi:phosphoserine phosphatase RsbU/P
MTSPIPELKVERLGVRRILDTLPDGTYITNVERRILFWSHSATRLTGWPADEVVGRTCSDNILVHIDKDGHRLCGQEHCPLHRSMVTGTVSPEPLLVFALHKQGHRIPVEVSVAPIRGRGGRVVGGIEVFRDLTSVMDDLRRARLIQNHTLESRLPDDRRIRFEVRYSPEEIVGGDFYRVEAVDADHYAIIVADVMGHGVASALYTMQLRSLWEDCRSELRAPAGFMSELNRRLRVLVGSEGYFATAVLVVLDAATGGLSCIRAGHPAPFLCRADGTIEVCGGKGPALGLFERSIYAESRDELRPGDSLLLFTDGAIEIEDARGEELGEAGLRSLLAKSRFGPEGTSLEPLERKLLAYTRRIRLPDDLTLLSLHRPAAPFGDTPARRRRPAEGRVRT